MFKPRRLNFRRRFKARILKQGRLHSTDIRLVVRLEIKLGGSGTSTIIQCLLFHVFNLHNPYPVPIAAHNMIWSLIRIMRILDLREVITIYLFIFYFCPSVMLHPNYRDKVFYSNPYTYKFTFWNLFSTMNHVLAIQSFLRLSVCT